MTFSNPNITGRASSNYDIAAALDAAVHGKGLNGFTAEISQELAHKHGGQNIRVPLAALVQAKATGSSYRR